ncbi:MAG: hypothetical protein AB7G11_00155 [Phycisphaerales bacterium]
MARARSEQANPIDVLMERASRALVRRRYFEAERLSLEGLRAAHAAWDFERMSRVVLPLEEARRQKRDMAFDAEYVGVVDDALPEGERLRAGCYLVCPPRVGADGRTLRDLADAGEIATIVVVREPTTREGLWPIVALGPVTIRTKVKPPESGSKRGREGRSKRGAGTTRAPVAEKVYPGRTWFLRSNEQLGDAALASVDATLDPIGRVDALMKRLEAHPDHEKLHQALGEACRECVRHVARHGMPKRPGTNGVKGAARAVYDQDL